jgi:hypothetical protein
MVNEFNITMVAFYGKNKPKELEELLFDIGGIVAANLPSSISQAFKSYSFPQIHATIIGMEVDVIHNQCYGHWFKENFKEDRIINIDRLQNILQEFVQRRGDNLFTIRFGGFPESHCQCKKKHPDVLHDWLCKSSQSESGISIFHSCDRAPYEGSFYMYPPGPLIITGWPISSPDELENFPHNLYDLRKSLEEAGLSDKYHYPENHEFGHWKDDDCFIRIGTFSHPLRAEQRKAIEAAVRNYLSERKPITVDITVNDISIILYDDPSLDEKSIRGRVSLKKFLDRPEKVKQLYDKVK